MDPEKIYRQYFDKIYKYCYFKTNRDQHTAEDLVSKVFYIFFQKWEQLNTRSELELLKWLYRTANIIIKEYYRTKEYVESLSDEMINLLQDRKNIDEAINPVLEDETYRYYIRAIQKRLNEKDKQLFDAIVIQHMSYFQIGQKLGIDQRAVQMRWIRLQKKIRTFICRILNVN